MLNRATRFASTTWSIPVDDLELSLEEIVGGLESRVVRAVFRARLHDREQLHPKTLIDWDYESDLAKSAGETLAAALNARDRYWFSLKLRRRRSLILAQRLEHGDNLGTAA